MKLSEIITLQRGLNLLTKLDNNGSGYFFGGKTQFDILKCKRLIKPLVDDFEAARQSIFKEVAPQGVEELKMEDHKDQILSFTAKVNDLLNKEETIEKMPTFTIEALQEKQPIPTGVLEMLFPIITDDNP